MTCPEKAKEGGCQLHNLQCGYPACDAAPKRSRKAKTIIHVNQHVIKANRATGARDPVLTVKTHKDNRYATRAEIKDASGKVVAAVVYSPDKPLSCGAHVWIETQLEVAVV